MKHCSPLTFMGAALAAAGFLGGCRTAERPVLGSAPDARFLSELSRGLKGQVELSRGALERAQDPQVKELARWITGEQSAMLADLKDAASALKVNLPASIDDEQRRLVRQILSQRGSQLDRAYLGCMVSDLEGTRTAFAEKSKTALDPEVRSFTEKHLPVLTDQLRLAREIQQSVGEPTPAPVVPRVPPGAVNNAGKVLGG